LTQKDKKKYILETNTLPGR